MSRIDPGANFGKMLFWGGLFGVSYLFQSPKQIQYRLPTPAEMEKLKQYQIESAKPFYFKKVLTIHSIAYLIAIFSPLLGILLFFEADCIIFVCLLIGGVLEFIANSPALLLQDNVNDYHYKLEEYNTAKNKKELIILSSLAIVVNLILIILNSYPFIIDSEFGIISLHLIILLYIYNIYSIVKNVKFIKNIDESIEYNQKFFVPATSASENAQSNNQKNKPTDSTHDQYTKITSYQNISLNNKASLTVCKANIRISNAICEAFKLGYLDITYTIVKQELEKKAKAAKRDFVKRECYIAIEIIELLENKSVDEVVDTIKDKFPI